MHQALLIDEILRQISFFALEYDRKSLVCAARTCRAWKDPALDFVWERLSSLGPLLLLLPGVSFVNGEYTCTNLSFHDLRTFNSYAKRVKHIRNTDTIKLNSSLESSICKLHAQYPALLSLSTCYMTIPRCNEHLIPLNMSFKLKQVDIDLGFKLSAQGPSVEKTVCEYLEYLHSHCHELAHISLRGKASSRVNGIITKMSNLISLSLRLGNSLLPETFASITTFPHLQELEVHTGHIQFSDVQQILENENHTKFMSLRKLHVRAKSSLIENMLEFVQPDILQHLHLELDDSSPSHSSWEVMCDIISQKASNTLRHLAFEHHFELPEQSLPAQSDTTVPQNSALQVSPMQFESLKKLRNLSLLRHLSCDFTLPLIVDEQDLRSLASWWPLLDHLNLGSIPDADNPNQYTPVKLTPASLSLFATKLPNLKTLILPFSVDDSDAPEPAKLRTPVSNRLSNITIAGLHTSNPENLAERLRCLFPALQNLEGPCDDTPTWNDLKAALQAS